MIEGNGHRPAPSDPPTPATRPVRTPSGRQRIAVLGILLASVTAAVAAGYVRDRGWVRVSSVETLDAREVLFLPEHRIFVVANGNAPVAFLGLSPNAGERVLYCRRAAMFQDEHGDAFDRFGRYLSGPSPRGLDRVGVRIKGDNVIVKPGRVDPGPARTVRAERSPGEPCRPDGTESPPGFYAEGA